MGACTVVCDFQRKQKLYRTQTLLTARFLEGTIINYIYLYFPWRDDLFGGGPISQTVYSMQKL